MTERAPHHPEHLPRPESTHDAEPVAKHTAEHAKPVRHEHREDLASIQKSIEQQAVSGAELVARHSEQQHRPSQHFGLTKELKRNALKKSLKRIQHHLPVGSRVFSKVVHQPMVDTVSNIGAKTVARPSGILGGGLVALAGSSALLYMAKHYGFSYNFLSFIMLFFGGFMVGLVLELIIRAVKRH